MSVRSRSTRRYTLCPIHRPDLRDKNPFHRRLADLGVELANLSLSARLSAGPAGENRHRAVEQPLLPSVNLIGVKLIFRGQLGDRPLVPDRLQRYLCFHPGIEPPPCLLAY